MKISVDRLTINIFLFFLLIVPTASYAQLVEIKHTFPKIVPVEIEFKDYEKENWWHHLEIKVTNTGKRPIYYLSMVLWLDATYPETGDPASGKQMAISFKFGDVERFFSSTNGEIAKPSDDAIRPGDSFTFTVPENYVIGYDLRKKLKAFNEPRTGELTHGWTNFGDGSGFLPGGTPWRISKKKRI